MKENMPIKKQNSPLALKKAKDLLSITDGILSKINSDITSNTNIIAIGDRTISSLAKLLNRNTYSEEMILVTEYSLHSAYSDYGLIENNLHHITLKGKQRGLGGEYFLGEFPTQILVDFNLKKDFITNLLNEILKTSNNLIIISHGDCIGAALTSEFVELANSVDIRPIVIYSLPFKWEGKKLNKKFAPYGLEKLELKDCELHVLDPNTDISLKESDSTKQAFSKMDIDIVECIEKLME